MLQCSFKTKNVKQPSGAYVSSECINKADILTVGDPCYGLCYACAYEKLKVENEKLRAKLNLEDCLCK